MMAIQPRGVLFDKDGTLFDFQATWGKVIEEVLDRLAPDRATWETLAEIGGYDAGKGRFRAGSPLVASANNEIAALWARFVPGHGADGIERLMDDVAQISLARPEFLRPSVPDLAGLLAELRAAGLALGVATHDSERSARVQLAAAGVIEDFDFIAGYDSGHGLKPGPGMLQAFAARAGIAPGEVVMVGDSRHDLEVGRNARARLAIGVLTGPATLADLEPFADHILPSIAGLPALLHGLRR